MCHFNFEKFENRLGCRNAKSHKRRQNVIEQYLAFFKIRIYRKSHEASVYSTTYFWAHIWATDSEGVKIHKSYLNNWVLTVSRAGLQHWGDALRPL